MVSASFYFSLYISARNWRLLASLSNPHSHRDSLFCCMKFLNNYVPSDASEHLNFSSQYWNAVKPRAQSPCGFFWHGVLARRECYVLAKNIIVSVIPIRALTRPLELRNCLNCSLAPGLAGSLCMNRNRLDVTTKMAPRWRYLPRSGLPAVCPKKIVLFPPKTNPFSTQLVRTRLLDIGLAVNAQKKNLANNQPSLSIHTCP